MRRTALVMLVLMLGTLAHRSVAAPAAGSVRATAVTNSGTNAARKTAGMNRRIRRC